MIFEIPLTATSEAYSLDVELDGVTYALDFSFSRRSSLWYLDLYYLDNGARVPVALGLAVLSGYPLLAAVVDTRRPAGELQVQCDGRDPGRDDLGSFAKLFYYDAAEFS
jgi:hypothetical protein